MRWLCDEDNEDDQLNSIKYKVDAKKIEVKKNAHKESYKLLWTKASILSSRQKATMNGAKPDIAFALKPNIWRVRFWKWNWKKIHRVSRKRENGEKPNSAIEHSLRSALNRGSFSRSTTLSNIQMLQI